MRAIFLLLLTCFAASAQDIPGTIVAAKITAGSTNNQYSIGDTREMKGTPKHVAGIPERNAISGDRREEGMYCWVISETNMYQLVGGTNNSNWTVITNGTGGGGTISSLVGLGIGSITNSYFWLWKAQSNGLIRAGGFGDSYGPLLISAFAEIAILYYGNNGSMYGGNYGAVNASTGATNRTSDLYWPFAYYDLGPGDCITNSHIGDFYAALNGTFVPANAAEVHYAKFTNGGTFRVLLVTNGGGSTILSTQSCASFSTTQATYSASFAAGNYHLVYQGITGPARPLYGGLWRSDLPGIRVTLLSQGGRSWDQFAAATNSIMIDAVKNSFDVLFVENTAEPQPLTTDSNFMFYAWNAYLKNWVTNMDVVFVKSSWYDTNSQGAYDFAFQANAIQSVGDTFGAHILDAYTLMGDYTNMFRHGWLDPNPASFDNLHRAALGSTYIAKQFIHESGFFDNNYLNIGGIYSRSGFFTRGQTISNSASAFALEIAGATGILNFSDRAGPDTNGLGYKGFVDYLGGLRLGIGQYQDGVAVQISPMFTVAADAYQQGISNATMGMRIGSTNKPVTVISTNSVDRGVFTAGSVMTSNSPANVLWYGADASGVADSTAAIQRAINSITEPGGEVFFPKGRYLVSTQIDIVSKTSPMMRGEGPNASRISWNGGAGLHSLFGVTNCFAPRFDGLYLEGRAGGAPFALIRFHGNTAVPFPASGGSPGRATVTHCKLGGDSAGMATNGLAWTADSDQNNDLGIITDVECLNTIDSFAYIGHSQSLLHRFESCYATSGRTAVRVPDGGGQFNWHGGFVGNHSVAAFWLSFPNINCHITEVRSEGDNMFYKFDGASSVAFPLVIDAVNFSSGSLTNTRVVMEIASPGPIQVEHCNFATSPLTTNFISLSCFAGYYGRAEINGNVFGSTNTDAVLVGSGIWNVDQANNVATAGDGGSGFYPYNNVTNFTPVVNANQLNAAGPLAVISAAKLTNAFAYASNNVGAALTIPSTNTSATTFYANGSLYVGDPSPVLSRKFAVQGDAQLKGDLYTRSTNKIVWEGGNYHTLQVNGNGLEHIIGDSGLVAWHSTTNGYVGIGTVTPATTLHLKSVIAPTVRLELDNASVTSGDIYGGLEFFSNDGSSLGQGVVAKVVGYTKSNFSPGFGNLGFYTAGNASNLMESMTVDWSGNVGIGYTTPSAPLSFGTASGQKILLYDGGGAEGVGFGYQPGLLQIHSGGSTDRTGIGYGSSAGFTEVLSVVGTKVGIGTVTPVSALDVPGTITAGDLKLTNGIASINAPTNTASYTVTNGTSLSVTNGNQRGLVVLKLAFDDAVLTMPSCSIIATNLVGTNDFGSLTPLILGVVASCTNDYTYPLQPLEILRVVDTSGSGSAVRAIQWKLYEQ